MYLCACLVFCSKHMLQQKYLSLLKRPGARHASYTLGQFATCTFLEPFVSLPWCIRWLTNCSASNLYTGYITMVQLNPIGIHARFSASIVPNNMCSEFLCNANATWCVFNLATKASALHVQYLSRQLTFSILFLPLLYERRFQAWQQDGRMKILY